MVLLALLPPAEPNEAEKLFRQMEEKVLKAKTLECVVEGTVEGTAKGVKLGMKATVLAGAHNQVRMDLTGEAEGKTEKLSIISDGMKVMTVEKEPAPAQYASKWLGESVRAAVARSGVTVPFILIRLAPDKTREFKVDEYLPISDFKLGKKETVGKHEAQVVEYTLTLKTEKSPPPIAVQVWIDTKSHVPLKRVLTGEKGKDTVTITETYTKVEIDGKIDLKMFELPK
jgi:outer membrane lipoprotein-sorting protein